MDPYLSWKEPRIADCMYELTSGELQDESHPPFKYFLMAMNEINARISFIPGETKMVDAGCGVGHYGELVRRHYPNMVYVGFDFSDVMVDRARNSHPELAFFEADAKTFDYSPYDIVLASSLIEVMDEWAGGAEAICKTAKDFVILHRVRVWGAPTERQNTTGYELQPTYTWVHDEIGLLAFFEERDFKPVWARYWDEFVDSSFDMATYVFRRSQ